MYDLESFLDKAAPHIMVYHPRSIAPPTKLGDAAVWRRHILQAGERQQQQAMRAAEKAVTADANSGGSLTSDVAMDLKDDSPSRRSNSAGDLDSPQHRDSLAPAAGEGGGEAEGEGEGESKGEDQGGGGKNRVLNVMQHRRRQRAVSANNNERNSR